MVRPGAPCEATTVVGNAEVGMRRSDPQGDPEGTGLRMLTGVGDGLLRNTQKLNLDAASQACWRLLEY